MDFFKLSENQTDIKREVLAGITTFMTMAYILAVNPDILGAAGMNKNGVFVATILSAVLGTTLMALLANYPFALAPGMGLNAFFAYSVVIEMGYSWEFALAAVFVEGIIFILLTLGNVREALFNAMPNCMKYSVSAGIGLFIAFTGLKNAGVIIADSSTYVTLGSMVQAETVLCMVGVILTVVLMMKNVKGAMLIGILLTWILGMGAQVIGWYQVDPASGAYSLFPNFTQNAGLLEGFKEVAFKFPSMSEIMGSTSSIINFIIVVFSFLFLDLFGTLGTLMGVASKANYLNEKGELPRIKQAFLADAIATTTGACLGTSTVTTFVESSAGVMAGGRTGLTAITTAICFLAALFLSPIFLAIPSFATAPALIIVGVMMLDGVLNIDFTDLSQAVPAFLTMTMMPFTGNIADGIIFGGLSYVLIKVLLGKGKEVSPMMYILSVLFIIQLILTSCM